MSLEFHYRRTTDKEESDVNAEQRVPYFREVQLHLLSGREWRKTPISLLSREREGLVSVERQLIFHLKR